MITEEELKNAAPGMRFRVVTNWKSRRGRQNSARLMDRWLGQLLTIEAVDADDPVAVTACECREWWWFPEMIEWIEEEEDAVFPQASDPMALFKEEGS